MAKNGLPKIRDLGAILRIHHHEVAWDKKLTHLNCNIIEKTHRMLYRMINQLDSQIGGLHVLQVKLPIQGEGIKLMLTPKLHRVPLMCRYLIVQGMEKLPKSYNLYDYLL